MKYKDLFYLLFTTQKFKYILHTPLDGILRKQLQIVEKHCPSIHFFIYLLNYLVPHLDNNTNFPYIVLLLHQFYTSIILSTF